MAVELAADVQVTRGVLERNRYAGIIVHQNGSLSAEDVVVRDTQPYDEFGIGLWLSGDASVEVARGLFERNTWAALMLSWPVSGQGVPEAAFTDVVVRDTASASTDEHGYGLWATIGSIALERALFERNGHASVALGDGDRGNPPMLTATDVVVRQTRAQGGLPVGIGLVVQDRAVATVSRVLIEDSARKGINTAEGSLIAEDLIVRGTESIEGVLDITGGLVSWHGSDVRITRGVFEGNRGAGIVSLGLTDANPQSRLQLTHVLVRGTRFDVCAELPEWDRQSCVRDGMTRGGGMGVGVFAGVEASLDQFRIEGSAQVGLLVGSDAIFEGEVVAVDPSLVARNGEITANAIGVNLQVADSERAATFEAVLLRDNAVDFARNDFPPPTLTIDLRVE